MIKLYSYNFKKAKTDSNCEPSPCSYRFYFKCTIERTQQDNMHNCLTGAETNLEAYYSFEDRAIGISANGFDLMANLNCIIRRQY